MQLEDFKAAALRVFYDIVNADGIIDINEVNLLDGLKKKYGITSHNGQENPVLIKNAHSITLGEALTTLAQWKQNDTENPKCEIEVASTGITIKSTDNIAVDSWDLTTSTTATYNKNTSFQII